MAYDSTTAEEYLRDILQALNRIAGILEAIQNTLEENEGN